MLLPFVVQTNTLLSVTIYVTLEYAQYCLTWRAQSATMIILAFMLELLVVVPLWTVTKSVRFYTRIKVTNYVSYATNIWINTINIVCWTTKLWNVQIIPVYIVFCFKSVPYELWLRILSISQFSKCRYTCMILRDNEVWRLYSGMF
jgi:hypothetical protein